MNIEVGREYSLKQGVMVNGGYFEGAKVKLRAYNLDVGCALVVAGDNYQFETPISNLEEVVDSNKPAHYDTGIDTIAFMRANCPPEQVEGFLRGNALKYLQRYDKKNGVDDLRKAKHYIEMLIEEVEGRE